MLSNTAKEFKEIPQVLSSNTPLRIAIENLIKSEPISGKSLEGINREIRFKDILLNVINGNWGLAESYRIVERDLPRNESVHANNSRVFASGWAERLVRIQISRFYNQAILEEMIAQGHNECFVPHSSEEDPSSTCSKHLAGGKHEVKTLLTNLIAAYRNNNYSDDLKIPQHPHCTHVVEPIMTNKKG